MFKNNMPTHSNISQYQPVFYFSGLSKFAQHQLLLSRKRRAQRTQRQFDTLRGSLIAKDQNVLEGPKKMDGSGMATLFHHTLMLNHYGLVDRAVPHISTLHHSKLLSPLDYALLIRSFSAEALRRCVCAANAQDDVVLSWKLVADHQGAERAHEARNVVDLCFDRFNSKMSNNVAGSNDGFGSTHIDALMSVYVTCGYESLCAVSAHLYDHMSTLRIPPTRHTYASVMLSLGLQGEVNEAQQVLSFLRDRCPEEIRIEHYNALLMGHRDSLEYEQCDQVWNSLVDSRHPKASVLTAELYLRSVVDHSYQKTATSQSRFSELTQIEKKKIPLILSQMETLGIPRQSLPPSLLDEVEDALRKYQIPKGRFYQWGRSIHQFNFIEFRRKMGWLYDIPEMVPTLHNAPPFNKADLLGPATPFATVEAPSFMAERFEWEQNPLQDVLGVTTTKEKFEDTRNSEFYYEDTQKVHQRSDSYVQEMPHTRFAQLYGQANPNIPKIGIRRHLQQEYVNQQEVLQHDAHVMRSSLATARRIRQRAEVFSTHRSSVSE